MGNVVIATGASQGLGKSFCIEYYESLNERERKDTTFFLIARNKEALQQTASSLSQSTVHVFPIDLGNAQDVDSKLHEPIQQIKSLSPQHIILLNCAGSTGDISKKVQDPYSHEDIRKYLELNFVTFYSLNSQILRELSSCPKKFLVNISSLYAVQPGAYWGLYCSIKAARDMLNQVITKEMESQGVRTLNYAPGPLEGEMQKEVRKNLGDPDALKFFVDAFNENKLVKLKDSAQKLVNLLKENKFANGSHVDYYDE